MATNWTSLVDAAIRDRLRKIERTTGLVVAGPYTVEEGRVLRTRLEARRLGEPMSHYAEVRKINAGEPNQEHANVIAEELYGMFLRVIETLEPVR